VQAQLLHLSGPFRGQTITYADRRISIGTTPDAKVRFPAGFEVAPHHAVITYDEEGCAFHLRAVEGKVFVNRQEVTEVILEEKDLIEIGEDGPRLRFRIQMTEGQVCKPVRRMLEDARDVMTESGLFAFSHTIGRDLRRHATRRLKIGFPIVIAVLAFLAAYFGGALGGRRTAREQESLRREQNELYQRELERIQEQFQEFQQRQAGGRAELERVRETLARHTVVVDDLVKADAALSQVLETYSRGVCLLHGAFTFSVERNGKPVRVPGHDGKPLELEYVGSGFLVSADGHVLTNRHVAEPWWQNDVVRPLLQRGMKPSFVRLDAVFPGKAPLAVDPATIKLSDEADVAVLEVKGVGDAPVLPLFDGDLHALRGRRVVLLGYPTGINALLARAEPEVVTEVLSVATDMTTLIAELANRDVISPIITQGALNDVREKKLVYDAATTSGGSGGPVFGPQGTVIGVNFAITVDFDGSNFGVPIGFGRKLLP